MEIRFGQQSGGGGGGSSNEVEGFVFADDTNWVLGPIGNVPESTSDTLLFWDPILQHITTDYTIRPVAGGSAPGYYICVSSSSSAPGGGTFSGGSNPTTGMASFLQTGDIIKLLYQPAVAA